jgi:hypothetical protein
MGRWQGKKMLVSDGIFAIELRASPIAVTFEDESLQASDFQVGHSVFWYVLITEIGRRSERSEGRRGLSLALNTFEKVAPSPGGAGQWLAVDLLLEETAANFVDTYRPLLVIIE